MQSKAKCDGQFRECMLDVCRKNRLGPACESQANMFMIGVTMAGCHSFVESQSKACKCVTRKQQPTRLAPIDRTNDNEHERNDMRATNAGQEQVLDAHTNLQ
jgi:hypothetical protein